MITGNVTPPSDLGPAIAALGEQGKQRLETLIEDNGGKLEHWMIAVAADYEREKIG